MAKRHALHTFIIANRIYRDATVTAFVADAAGAATAGLATLYDALTGSNELENPIQLDGEGKFDQAVYTEDSVVLEVSGLHITTHQTGVITPGGQWRGDYAAATLYQSGDFIRQGDSGQAATYLNIYQAANTFTSSTFAADVADPLKLALVIDYVALTAATFPVASQPTVDAGTNNTQGVTPLTLQHKTWTPTLGSTARKLPAILGDHLSAKDFGATGDGVTDDTAALNAWLAAGGGHLPAGTYKTSAPLTITVDGTCIIGDGPGKSIISCSDTDTAGISIAAFQSYVDLANFRLTRSVTAVAGGNGISCLGSVSQCMIRGLLVDLQYRGLALSSTDFSTVRDCIVEKSQDSGVFLTNTAGNGSLQWSMHNMLSQKNVGRGFMIASTAGPSSVSLGTYSNLATFANSSNGLLVSGLVGVPIHGLRLENSFLGQDGTTEISLDTFGGYHAIRNCHVELAGTRTTGPTLATAASNTGNGITITANNLEVELIGNDIDGNSLNGAATSATKSILVGNNVTNNGMAGTVGEQTGIKFIAGVALIVGNRVGNRSGSSQQVGILVNVDAATMVGNDLAGNTTSPVTLTVTPPVVSATAMNGGYVTENGGTATIASGTTAITVTHGLSRAPRAQEIWFTPTENPTTDQGNMWVDTITSTQFNINCRTNPGASNLDVSWGARLK